MTICTFSSLRPRWCDNTSDQHSSCSCPWSWCWTHKIQLWIQKKCTAVISLCQINIMSIKCPPMWSDKTSSLTMFCSSLLVATFIFTRIASLPVFPFLWPAAPFFSHADHYEDLPRQCTHHLSIWPSSSTEHVGAVQAGKFWTDPKAAF